MTLLLAALTGAVVCGGLLLLIAGLAGHAPLDRPPGRPPSRLATAVRRLAAPAHRRRLGIAAGAAVGVLALTGWPVAALGAALAGFGLPLLLSRRAPQQVIARLEALEQWSRRLADVLASGRGLEEALMSSVRTAPAPIAAPVRALGRRLQMRAGTEEALRQFADDLDDPIGDRIAAALILAARRRGQGVRTVLTGLARMVAADVAARRQIEAERAHYRTTLRWIAIFLAGFTLFAALTRSYVAPYGTVLGQLVLALVLTLYGLGLWWIHRLGTAPSPGRFLPADPDRESGERAAS
ncbi:type II secretion system F family protein [Acrocarpospora sp. B8E8]|uniref:type II secretion system F family protein n=1 Tax=Acrocarpospora sp. B8E8 TaxID=3153572 RepID=UPI00325D8ED3